MKDNASNLLHFLTVKIKEKYDQTHRCNQVNITKNFTVPIHCINYKTIYVKLIYNDIVKKE